VAAEIEKNHKVKTKVITLDFTEPDAVFEAIAKGIQVNNIFKVVLQLFIIYLWSPGEKCGLSERLLLC
jgi:hypothetical protein